MLTARRRECNHLCMSENMLCLISAQLRLPLRLFLLNDGANTDYAPIGGHSPSPCINGSMFVATFRDVLLLCVFPAKFCATLRIGRLWYAVSGRDEFRLRRMVAHNDRHCSTALRHAGYLTLICYQLWTSTLFHFLVGLVHKECKLALVYTISIKIDTLCHVWLVLKKLLYVLRNVVDHLIVSLHHRIIVVALLCLVMLVDSIVVRLVLELVLV